MAKRHTFGALSGVFTPALLALLGVILYLRLPRIVGDAGLWATLGLILAAHVISVTAGLSLASIATDRKLATGGPYDLVARSLGLPLGGTFGLALFLGLSLSVSLYVLGLCESLLPLFGSPPDDPDALRIAGSAALAALTLIALVVGPLARKLQLVVLAAIALSLVALFASGQPLAPAADAPALAPAEGGRSLITLFGLFFPAVIGFTAGMNLSRDLDAPQRALPRGTLAAIATALALYLALAVYLGLTVDRAQLRHNPDVLLDLALAPELVYAGLWAATVFAALASLLGASRVLHATSQDRLTPALFARGVARDGTPNGALLVAFVLAEAGVLAGDFDLVATALALLFIATYGLINLGYVAARWTRPDFHPTLRVPVAVSLLGALASVAAAALLDLVALIATTAVLFALFLFYQRRELRRASGDAWGGVWTAIARAALRHLTLGRTPRRAWRPNLMVFSARDAPSRPPLIAFTASLMSGRGVMTDFELVPAPEAPAALSPPLPATPRDDARPGVFHRPTPTDDVFATIASVCRFYGFSGLEPNTVALDWSAHRHAPDRLTALLDAVAERDLNLLVLSPDAGRGFGERRRVDLWFADDGANLSLGLALARLFSTATDWRRCTLRFVIAGADAAHMDRLQRATQRVLEAHRIAAQVVTTLLHGGPAALEERLRQLSGEADLLVLGLADLGGRPAAAAPTDPAAAAVTASAAAAPATADPAAATASAAAAPATADPAAAPAPEPPWIAPTEALLRATSGSVLLLRASRRLEDALRQVAGYTVPAARRLPLAHGADASAADVVAPLVAPEDAALEVEARRFAHRLEGALATLHARHLAPLHAHHRALVERLIDVVERPLAQLERAAATEPPARLRKAIARAQTAVLFQAQRALDGFAADALPTQRDLLAGAAALWRDSVQALGGEVPGALRVARAPEDFEPEPHDPGPLRRLKWRRRASAWLRRGVPRYHVVPRALSRYWVDHRATATVQGALEHTAAASYRLVLELGRIAGALAEHLGALEGRVGTTRGEALARAVAEELAQTLAELDVVREGIDGDVTEDLRQLARSGRALAQGYADDLDRLDVARVTRRERRLPPATRGALARLDAGAATWAENQRLTLGRATLPLRVATQHRRLTTICERWSASLVQRIEDEVVAPLRTLGTALRRLRDGVVAGGAPRLEVAHDFKPRFDPGAAMEALGREAQAPLRELPEKVEVVANAALGGLEARPFAEAEGAPVALARLVGAVVEAELVGDLQRAVAEVPEVERQATRVGQDVVRLVSYTASELVGAQAPAEVARTQLLPLVDAGLARVAMEIARAQGVATALAQRVVARLAVLRERTDVYALAAAPDPRRRYGRGWRKRVREAVAAARRAVSVAARRTIVGLVYRQSRGVLLARRLTPGVRPADAVVARTLALVQASSPRPEVLEALPFYYRQLFLGRSTSDTAFWVGREDALAAAAVAVASHRRGVSGAVLVVGVPGSGRSALVQRLVGAHFDGAEVYRVTPPAGGSVDEAVFARRVSEGLRLFGGYDEMFRTVNADAVVIFEDAELWWERSAGGLAVFEVLLGLVDRWGDRCLFVIELNTWAFRAIGRFVGLAGRALAVLECGAVDARTLEAVIEARHGSTGLGFELEGRAEADLGEVRRARLFAARFAGAHGLIGPALQGWVAAISAVRGETLVLDAGGPPDAGALDDLPLAAQALLVQLALHRALTLERLARIYREGGEGREGGEAVEGGAAGDTATASAARATELAQEVAALVRMGLVVRDGDGVLALDRFVRHGVTRRLEERGMLP